MAKSFLTCFPANMPASFSATMSGGQGWMLTGSTRSACFPASVQPSFTSGSERVTIGLGIRGIATKPASVAGTVPLDDSKCAATWNDVAEIRDPSKLILNLKVDTSKLTEQLNLTAKKMGRTIADAMDKAILGIMNMSKAMVPLGKMQIPLSVGYRVEGGSDSKPIVASGQVAYAPVIHETFTYGNLRADEIVAKLVKRFR